MSTTTAGFSDPHHSCGKAQRGRAGQLAQSGHVGLLAQRGRVGQLTQRGRVGQLAQRDRVGQLAQRSHVGQFFIAVTKTLRKTPEERKDLFGSWF